MNQQVEEHKYNVIDILHTPIYDYDIKKVLWKSEEKITKYYEDVKNIRSLGTEKRLYNYKYKRYIDYSKYFAKTEYLLLEKLDIQRDFFQKYTEEENERFAIKLNKYWDGGEDMYGNFLSPCRKLELTGISRDDYNRLYEKLNKLKRYGRQHYM